MEASPEVTNHAMIAFQKPDPIAQQTVNFLAWPNGTKGAFSRFFQDLSQEQIIR
jgi:hypothetical protein